MAKSDINLHIGSTFSKEGFDKLERSMKSASGRINSLGEVMEKVSSAMGNSVGRVGATITKLAGGLAAGGPLGVGIAIAQAGVTKLIEMWQTWKDKSVEKAKEVAEALKTAVSDAVTSAQKHLDTLVLKVKESGENRNADFRMGTIKGKGMLDRMEIQRANEMRGKSGEAAAEINLKWEKKIQGEKTKDSIEAERNSNQDLADQTKLVNDLNSMLNQLKDKRGEFQRRSADYTKQLDHTDPDSFKNKVLQTHIDQTDKASAAIEAQINEYESRIREETRRIKPLQEKAEQARQDRLTQELASQAKIKDAEQKVNDEIRKKYDKINADEKKKRDEKAAADAKNKQAQNDHDQKVSAEIKEEVRKRTIKDLRNRAKQTQEEGDRKQAEQAKVIDDAKKRLDKFNELADDAKSKNFNQWAKANKDESIEQAKENKKEEERIKQNDSQLKSLRNRIFGRNGELLKSANKKDIQQYEERLRWKELHDPNNRAKLEQDLKKAEEEKKKIAEDTKKEIERIYKMIEDKLGV